MSKLNYSISDCLTFGLIILFLFGALLVGPKNTPYNINYLTNFPIQRTQVEILGRVDPAMINLYNR
jgi:hypothetical protein